MSQVADSLSCCCPSLSAFPGGDLPSAGSVDEINTYILTKSNSWACAAVKVSVKSWFWFDLGYGTVSYPQLTSQRDKFWFQQAENTVLPKEGRWKYLVLSSYEQQPLIQPRNLTEILAVQIQLVILSSGFGFDFVSIMNIINKIYNTPGMLPWSQLQDTNIKISSNFFKVI